MKAVFKNLTLLAVSLFVSALIFEVFLRAFVDIRDVGPSFSTYDPVLGKALKKDFSVVRSTPEFEMTLTTNQYGFRGPEIESLGAESILFLGDSFTMGYGVSDGAEYPALIRQRLRDQGDMVTVINAGMGGNGNGWWLKWLKHNVEEINPRHVILQFYFNDLDDNISEAFYILGEDNNLIELPVQAPSMQRRVQSLIEGIPGLANSYSVGFARQVVHSFGASGEDQDVTDAEVPAQSYRHPAQDLQIAIVRDVMKLLERKNTEITILLVDLFPDNLAALQSFFHAREIEPVVISGRTTRPDLYYDIDFHWNAMGHEHASSMVWEEMTKTQ